MTVAAETSRAVGERHRRLEFAAFAVLAYVPFLLSSPGRVSADTKQYLYLDPGRLLARAPYLWDPHIGVRHGPAPEHRLPVPDGAVLSGSPSHAGVPDWVAQRLWLGSISLAAALGARWFFARCGIGTRRCHRWRARRTCSRRTSSRSPRGSPCCSCAWAGLPWLVGLTIARRYGAGVGATRRLFALVVLTIGSVNASSLLFVGIAPALWLVLEHAGDEPPSWRRARDRANSRADARRVASGGSSGLPHQGSYGLPVLQLTESVRTVAADSNPIDVLRGIGNWFFYGRDRLGFAIDQASSYAGRPRGDRRVVRHPCPRARRRRDQPLAPPRVLRAPRRRGHRRRRSVRGPSTTRVPYGRLFEYFAGTPAGLALRNTPRVVPLLVLGLAGLARGGYPGRGAMVRSALADDRRRRPRVRGADPGRRHGFLSRHLDRPEDVPDYWKEAIAAHGPRGRRHARPRDPRERLRRVSLGRHHRTDHARADRPSLRGDERRCPPAPAPSVNLLGRARPASPGGHPRTAGTRGVRAPRGHRHHRAARRPRVRALRHCPAVSPLGSPHRSPASWDPGTGAFRETDQEPAARRLPGRRPAATSASPSAPATRRPWPCSASRTRSRSCTLRRRVGPCCSTVMPTASSMPRQQTCSTAGHWSSRQPRSPRRSSPPRRRRAPTCSSPIPIGAATSSSSPGSATTTATPSAPGRTRPPTSSDSTPSRVHRRRPLGGRAGGWHGRRHRLHHREQSPGASSRRRPRHSMAGRQRPGRSTSHRAGRHGPDHRSRHARTTSARGARPDDRSRHPLLRRRIAGLRCARSDVDDGGRTDHLVPVAPDQTGDDPGRRARTSPATDAIPSGSARSASATSGCARSCGFPWTSRAALGTRANGHRLDVVLSRAKERPRRARRRGDHARPAVPAADSRSYLLTGTARVDPDAPDTTIDAALGTTAPGVQYTASSHLAGDAEARASRAFDHDRSTAWTPSLENPTGSFVDVSLPTAHTVDRMQLTFVDDTKHFVPTQVTLVADGQPARPSRFQQHRASVPMAPSEPSTCISTP